MLARIIPGCVCDRVGDHVILVVLLSAHLALTVDDSLGFHDYI